jgi:hypothetical protein
VLLLALFLLLNLACSVFLFSISFVLCLRPLCYFQELQKSEAEHITVEAWTSKAGEASAPKAPSADADAQKPGEATSTPPADPEV